MIRLDLTAAELGWLLLAIRTQRKHDDQSVNRTVERFGAVDPTSGIALRAALGAKVAERVKRWPPYLPPTALQRAVRAAVVELIDSEAGGGKLRDVVEHYLGRMMGTAAELDEAEAEARRIAREVK